MLANLDNEVIFKKAFTDKTVFKAFVRDILGIEIEVDKIETEKKFDPEIGYVDFELDIFAESVDKRVCVEIQRVEYDPHPSAPLRTGFDRFLHYFLMLIAEQQRSSKEYGIDRTVYVIVVLTAPYKISEKNGKPILDEVLLLKLNPQTLQGEIRELYGHQFVCLNPNHPNEGTPQQIRDWLDLIYQSIHSPERPVLNIQNEGIKRAIELISFDKLTPEERTLAKNKEAARITLAKTEEYAKRAEKIENAKSGIAKGYNNHIIADITGLTIQEVEALRNAN
ncbi:MAG TPA: PD-(D/E)XK nuclease family transposase [Rhodothermales bacterium]|nr:PD-(D/E)XK nuclease family transposase [Rhodothermales bacterium]